MKLKRLLLAVAVLLVAEAASAQTALNIGGSSCTGGTTVNTTSGQDAAVTQRVKDHNAQTCKAKGQSPDCTQVQLDGVSGCAAGACGTIYATTAAGVRQYFGDRVVGTSGIRYSGETVILDAVAAESADIAKADVVAAAAAHSAEIATNAQCTAAGLGNGCTKGQVSCSVYTGRTDCK